MARERDHTVGLRELRHDTSRVMDRVRAGETLDVTAHGRLVARLVPVDEPDRSPLLERLIAEGKLTPAKRPGYFPAHRAVLQGQSLGEALQAQRDEENW